jgi:hypothetical protein
MKKQDVVARVQELIQDDSGTMQSLVGRWVDLTLLDMSARAALPSLYQEQTTELVESQRDYTIPDSDRIVKVFVPAWGSDETGGILLKRKNDVFLNDMLTDGVDTEGRPIYYSIFADSVLRLHPIPDADNAPASPTDSEKLHIYLIPNITELASADDITEIKEKHIPTIFWGTYQFAGRYRSAKEVEEATVRYRDGIANMKMDIYNDPELPMVAAYHDF